MPSYSPIFGTYTSESLSNGLMPRLNSIRRVVGRDGYRATKALFDALIGATTGGTAAATHKRIAAPTNGDMGSNGGLRTIDTITDIDRVTTAADITTLENIVVDVSTQPAVYPADLSGNGGPALTV